MLVSFYLNMNHLIYGTFFNPSLHQFSPMVRSRLRKLPLIQTVKKQILKNQIYLRLNLGRLWRTLTLQ